MSEQWHLIDLFFKEKLHTSDPLLESVIAANAEAQLPAIDVAPNQGKLLYLLAKLANANTILELGTLGGYSTIWLGRALPEGGRLVTLELEPHHAQVAADNIGKAGLSAQVEIVVGPALDTLPTLAERGFPSFDLIFIDADKPNYPNYLQWALHYSRPGTVIIADNVVRQGRVIDGDDPNVQGVRRFIELLSAEPRIEATAVQTVGSKGHDGFVLGIVK